MLQVFIDFCDFMGTSPSLALGVSILGLLLFGLEGKNLSIK